MCIALNGLAVGMGVIYPNLREENPSKIVSGFGGTFCLVISFIYIGAMLILLSIGSPYGSPWQIWRTSSLEQQATFLSLFAVTSLATGLGPLWYALRKARRFEH
jgi:ABC-2 type transport system permease protein